MCGRQPPWSVWDYVCNRLGIPSKCSKVSSSSAAPSHFEFCLLLRPAAAVYHVDGGDFITTSLDSAISYPCSEVKGHRSFYAKFPASDADDRSSWRAELNGTNEAKTKQTSFLPNDENFRLWQPSPFWGPRKVSDLLRDHCDSRPTGRVTVTFYFHLDWFRLQKILTQ